MLAPRRQRAPASVRNCTVVFAVVVVLVAAAALLRGTAPNPAALDKRWQILLVVVLLQTVLDCTDTRRLADGRNRLAFQQVPELPRLPGRTPGFHSSCIWI